MANDYSSEDYASGSKSGFLNLDTDNIWGQINLCWGQEEKGTTEDEMAGWHHRLNGHEFE